MIFPHPVQLLPGVRRYPVVVKNFSPVGLHFDFTYSKVVWHQNVTVGIHEANTVNFVGELDLSQNLFALVPDPDHTMIWVTGWCHDQAPLLVEVDSRQLRLIFYLLIWLHIE